MKVRIAFSYTHLAQFVQKQLQTQGLLQASGNLARIEIALAGKIQFFEQNGRLESRLPLHIKAGLPALSSLIPGLPKAIMRLGAVDMELMVEMSTTLRLTPDLALSARTKAGYRFIKAPQLGLALLKVPLEALLAPALQRELDKVARQIDQEMIRPIPIPTFLQEAWQALWLTHPIEEAPLPLYLQICPSTKPAPHTPLIVGANGVMVDFFLEIAPQVSLTPSAKLETHPPLPDITEIETELPEDPVQASLSLQWAQLRPWLCAQHWPITPPIQHLTVLDIQPRLISPEEIALDIDLDLRWKAGPVRRHMRGIWQTRLIGGVRAGRIHLYLKGPHRWQGRRLDRWLVGSLGVRRWEQLSLELNRFMHHLQEEWIETLKGIAEHGLKGEGFHLTGNLEQLTITDFAFHPEHIQVGISVDGQTRINLQP